MTGNDMRPPTRPAGVALKEVRTRAEELAALTEKMLTTDATAYEFNEMRRLMKRLTISAREYLRQANPEWYVNSQDARDAQSERVLARRRD